MAGLAPGECNVDADSVQATYKVAVEVAETLSILKAIQPKTSRHPGVAKLIRDYVPRVVAAARDLKALVSTSDILSLASRVHPDVVRCGELAGASFLDITLQLGERCAMVLILLSGGGGDQHSLCRLWDGAEVSDVDVSGVIAKWDGPYDLLGFLAQLDSGLHVALNKECQRLTASADAQRKAKSVRNPKSQLVRKVLKLIDKGITDRQAIASRTGAGVDYISTIKRRYRPNSTRSPQPKS
jgi:hypothetical protein